MILTLDNWSLGYEQVLRDCRCTNPSTGTTGTGTVLLLVAPTTDAICAAKILTFMLRSDEVPYTLLPCYNRHELLHRLEILEDSVQAVVCIDCGAGVNLVDKAGNSSAKIYVMDGHRPVHLANVYAGMEVVVYLEHDEDLVSDGDYLSGVQSSSSEEESDSEMEEVNGMLPDQDDDLSVEKEWKDDDDDTSVMTDNVDSLGVMSRSDEDPAKELFDGQAQDEDDDMVDAIEDNDDEDEMLKDSDDDKSIQSERSHESFATHRSLEPENDTELQGSPILGTTQQQYLHERKRKIENYYSTTSYGAPVSFVAWMLCSSLRFGSAGDLLWYGCVGVTDAFTHKKMDKADYMGFLSYLRADALRIYPNSIESNNQHGYATEDGTLVTGSANGRILTSATPSLPMLTYWNLFDSLKYSTAIASQSPNLSKVHDLVSELLATVGVPLIEAKQNWPFMSAKLRATFQASLEKHSETFGIENIILTQFLRVQGYNTLISASDVSLASAALLEGNQNSSVAFNSALDALSSIKALREGIELAKTQLTRLHSAASLLIERNGIVRLSHFRYAHLTGDMGGITGALGLGRLAAFLMDLHRANGKWTGNKALPLILLLDHPSKSYTLVSAHNYSESDVIMPAKFHAQLALTAESIASCQMEIDGFDGCVVRIESSIAQRGNSHEGNMGQNFVEQLHYLMDAA